MLLIREGLKRELSESELTASQFHQALEHRCSIAKACCQVLLQAMKDLLEMVDDGDSALDALDDHAIIALARLPKLPVDRLVPAFAEAQVGFAPWSAPSTFHRPHQRVGRACWPWPRASQ
jgi:hypothetical protein